MYKLVILDRDGVINQDSDDYIKTVDEFILIPGSINAIAQLNKLGIKVAIATNQSGIARNFTTVDILNQMHDKLTEALKSVGGHIDKIYYCPHAPDEKCDCRKPKPGMIKRAMQEFNIEHHEALMIGDSIRDLQAAEAANVNQVLVKTGKGLRSINKMTEEKIYLQVPVFENLAAAIKETFKPN